MISYGVAVGLAIFCIILGVVGLTFCYTEDMPRKFKIFWRTWLVVWGTPLLVPAYLVLWLGA